MLTDDSFYVKLNRLGLYNSFDKENNPLVTSLTEEECIITTRFYLKGKQEGFSDNSVTYDSFVGGKL